MADGPLGGLGNAAVEPTITIRYYAAARAAAGVAEERLIFAPGATVDTVLKAAVAEHGAALDRVLARCSYLVDETAVHGRDLPLSEGAVLDVLPPFAGGC